MSPVSSSASERSRKSHALTLQRLASVGQNNIAEQLQTSEATVSRFVSAALGLKVVPLEMKCYEPRKIAILMELARDHLNQLDTVEQLSFD